MTAPSQEAALQALLQRAAGQVRLLGGRTQGIEEAVGAAVSEGFDAGPLRERLQALDGLVQALTGMADYLDGLAETVEPALRVDPAAALGRVRQRDLARGLAGEGGGEGSDSGSADFF